MLDVADFYWGIIVALAGTVWALILFARDRRSACVELSSSLIRRIHELDKAIIEHPDVQKYLSLSAKQDESYFRSPEVLQDLGFYKAKSFAYWHLNLFDEIMCNAAVLKSSSKVLTLQVAELSDWESYMMHIIGHPLYRSILNNEGANFGSALQAFWTKNQSTVDSLPVDPYSW